MTLTQDSAAPRRSRIRRILGAPAFVSSLCIALAVFAANAAFLLRIRSNNPLLYHSGLGSPTRGVVRGVYTIDANDGWTAQALGRLSAQSWLHGHVPLWNVYEGLGQPLAGEMQSAALFLPFILLQLLPNGIFVMHLALELVAGFSTLLFLRSLRLSWTAATCGACLFALNGAFSVMTNAPFNPIAFLPMALWGVELIAERLRTESRPRLGLWVTALAFAFMLFSGFPETAFLEGMFVAGWALFRLIEIRGHRRSFAAWMVLGVVAGVAIAAPALIAFKNFLDFGFTAYHAGSANAGSYPTRQITSLGLPYAVGPAGNHVLALQAGYVTLSAALIAFVGFVGKRHRALQVILGLITVVLLLNMFGFGPAKELVNLVPGMRNILVFKYGLVLIEFAVVIGAAFGIDDMRRSRVRWWAILTAGVLAGGYLVGSFAYLHQRDYINHVQWTMLVLTWTVVVCGLIVLLAALTRSKPRGAGLIAILAAAIVVLDAAGTYAVPQLSASSRNAVDLAPVRYLQAHLGTYRFYTLGPISPNYGSYFGIAQLNANDLPVPKKYSTYLTEKLRPADSMLTSEGTRRAFNPYQLVPFNPGVKDERILLEAYGQLQANFRAASARYVVMRRGVSDASTGIRYGLTRVFQDAKVEIWEDPHAAPYYSTSRGICDVVSQSRTDVTLNCPAPATLVRRELSTPDWTATVNGKDHAVADDPGRLFQSITLPAGVSTVTFAYRPRHFVAATAVSVALVAFMLLDGCAFLVLRRRSATRNGEESTQRPSIEDGEESTQRPSIEDGEESTQRPSIEVG